MIRIAIFGPPGSGKTTLAKKISQSGKFKIIEASEAVIFPIAAKFDKFPAEKKLLEHLKKISNKKFKIEREKAMETFSRLQKKYSSDFIARALHVLYVDNPKYENIIFSGLRGRDNSKYCRLHNDFVVYLRAEKKDLIGRLEKDRGYTKGRALQELKKEEKLFKTKEIEKIADLVLDTSAKNLSSCAKELLQAIKDRYKICKRCVNTAKNPAMKFDKNGYCHICSDYIKNFDRKHLMKELEFLETFKGTGKKHDVIVGISGGKDSTATLYTIKKMGFNPLAVTFNLGYLPKTTIPRAREMAKLLGVDYEVVDIRKYIRKIDLESYKKTAAIYDLPFDLDTKIKFQKAYAEGRRHYSIKCKHSPVFVRSCQLCRRMVVRAYYGETLKRGARAFVLGINEWTNLSAAQSGKKYKVSGLRKLQPRKSAPPVYIFHLPFLLQRTSKETKKILDFIGWTPPAGEDFIESNSNSCLYARAAERTAKRLLEFHPDSTRLAREVTVGFINKKQALAALGKIHPYKFTPRQVLIRAGILKK